MRIISKFKDYCDIGMQYGQDEDIVWVRNTEEVPGELNTDWLYEYTLNSLYYCVTYLAFCGKIYPLHGQEEGLLTKPDPNLFSSSYEELVERFEKFTNKKVKNPDYPYYGWMDRHEMDNWINTPCHDLHIKYDCPVLLFKAKRIGRKKGVVVVKCPVLKDLGFQRVKDAYTTFQEIETYISNNMCQKQNPMVVLSDKSKIVKHGFDYKLSFRKGKQ
jgi:hypothetical protein